MTKQRLISDARRRARALSVETGRPYQTHLDDVAHMAGREDWKAFTADPVALPAAAVMEPAPASALTPEITTSKEGTPGRRPAWVVGAVLTAAMPIAAAAAVMVDSDRMNEASARVAAEATMLAHVHAPLVGFAQNRTFPARIGIRSGTVRIVTLALTDMRVVGASRLLRHLPGHEPVVFVGDALGGRSMRDALSQGAVMRLVVEVNCAAATTRYLRYEAARDMTSRPILARRVADSTGPHAIDSAIAAKDVCEAPATPPIHIM